MYGFELSITGNAVKEIRNMFTSVNNVTEAAKKLQGVFNGLKPIPDSFIGHVKNTKAGLTGMGGVLGGLKSQIAGVFAVGTISAFGNEVIKTLSEFEKYEAVLTNTLGSNMAAKGIMEGITDFAAKTPFEVNELTNSFVKLANQGFAPNLAEMTKLGDLASSTGKDFGMLAEGIIDAQVGEFERLKEFGIQASKDKKTDNITFMFKNQSKTIRGTADEIRKYILSLGKMEGVAGAMDAISKTTGGQISNMKDQITAFQKNVGEAFKPMINDVLTNMTTAFTGIAKWVKENLAGIREWSGELIRLGAWALSVYGVFQGYSAITATLAFLKTGVISVTTRVITMGLSFLSTSASALGFVYQAVIGVGSLVGSLLSATAAQFGLNIAMSANPIGLIILGVSALAAVFYGLFKYIDNAFPNFFGTVTKYFKMAFDFVWNTFIKPIQDFFAWLFGSTNQATQTMQTAAEQSGKDANQSDAYNLFKKTNPNATAFDFAKNKVGAGSVTGGGIGLDKKNKDITGENKQVKNITITINSLISGGFTVVTNTINESEQKIKDVITRVLIDATNQVNYQ
jgi:hypothetical protein